MSDDHDDRRREAMAFEHIAKRRMPKDLDQWDVEQDARRMRAQQEAADVADAVDLARRVQADVRRAVPAASTSTSAAPAPAMDPVAYAEAVVATEARNAWYGVDETNPLGPEGHPTIIATVTMRELERAGGRITRLRLLTEDGFPYFDISYIRGRLPSGAYVDVRITSGVRIWKVKGRRPSPASLVALARDEGVHGRAIGLLDETNWSLLT